MKFSKLFLAFFLAAFTVSAQTYMPDDNFESWCEASGYGDGVLDNDTISSSAASFPTQISIANLGISDLTGIEAFVSLTNLDCAGNDLMNIDISFLGNNLTILNSTLQNVDLYCITVFDTAFAANNAGFFQDSITSYSTNCLTAFGCIDPLSCNNEPTYSIDTTNGTSCYYSVTTHDTVDVCDTYLFGGINRTVSGSYTNVLTTVDDCDSNVVLALTIRNSTASYDTTSFLVCDSYIWNNVLVDISGDIEFSAGLNAAGCDSTAWLHAIIEDSNTGSSSDTACDIYSWEGQTITSSADLVHTYTNADGCDSTHTLSVTIYNSYNILDSYVECNPFTWIDGITYTSSNNTADSLYQSINGCDSLVTLNLTIDNSHTYTDTQEHCDTYTWIDGVTYTASNSTAAYMYTTVVGGCDSLIYLDLTINYSNVGASAVTGCDSYYWEGQMITSSGDLVHTYQNATGCDSIHTLSVTINYSTSGSLDTTVCSLYTNALGNNLDTTAIYTFVLTNAVGCDSVVTLDLTVNYPDNSLTTDSACESYVWNGMTYTTTNTYYFNTLTVGGCDSVAVLDLLVGYNEIYTNTVDTCDNYEWLDANDNVIITALNSDISSGGGVGNYGNSGIYIDTVYYTNQGGCDSIEILNLTLTQNIVSSSQSIDIFACDGWAGPDGVYYTTTGIANIVTGTTLGGCDSLQSFNINIAPEKSTIENIVACDSYTWIIASGTSASSLFDTTVYTSSGLHAKVYYVEHTFSGDSTITCDSIAYLYLTINPSTTSISDVNECVSYLWNGTSYDTSGVYTFATTNSNGCDSTATLNLIINYSAPVTIDTQVFCDSIYTWLDGNIYSVPVNANSPYTNTIATHMLQTVDGCDSLIMLDLTIYPSYSLTLPADTFCDSYDWYLDATHSISNIISSGLYTIQFSSINGCDSLISLDFTIDNSHTHTDVITACDSYVWIQNGQTYYTSNNSNSVNWPTVVGGCDSIIYLDLTIIPSTTSSSTLTECDTYSWNGITYDTSGVYTFSTINSNNCDSTATLNLTINYSNAGATSVTACDSYDWDGVTYITTDAYTNTYINVAGCDSVHTLNLTIDNTVINYDTITSCYEYTWQPILYLGSTSDWTFDTTSTFNAGTNSLTKTVYGNSINSSVCIDISNLYLTINPLEYGSDAVVACDSYLWEGNVYTASGIYVETIQGTLCDSVATLTLTINYSNSSTDFVGTHCDEYTWIDGNVYTQTDNTTTYTLTNSLGCDSIITLDLVIVNSTDVFVTESGCDSYYWAVSDTLYTSSGIHSHTYAATNSVGCDSTIWITLTLNNSSIGSVDITACDNYTWDGVVYDSTDSYTNLYTDANGCDSSMTLNLTIATGSTGSVNITACDDFTWDGVVYDLTGSYTNLYTDANGCDSSMTLNLTVNNSSNNSLDITACDDYTWYGVVYDLTGSYTNLYTDVNGCDSSFTLNLTINNSSLGSVDITACDNYTWDGVVYDSTDSYTNLYTDVNGCDSSMTLNLTIATGSTGSVNITACDDFVWDGVVYDSTGSYTNLYTDLNGCDSSMTLNLTIATGSTDSVNITVCDDFTWDGIVYDSTGFYTNLYADVNGCDSVVTLNLTINTNGTSSIDNVGSHCDSYTWIDGVTYTTSNSTATMTYVNAAGCDSIITLNLIITDDLVVSISYANNNLSALVTGGTSPYSYLWTGAINSTTALVTPTVSGDYCVQVTDINGCVSSEVCENVTISALNDLDVSKFNIYPNPTSDFLTLDFHTVIKGDYTVKIISSNGNQVYEDRILDFNGDYSKNINLSNLAKGNYIIQIHSDDEVVYRKILLQ